MSGDDPWFADRINERRRERFCVPLDRDTLLDAPFFCSLGTLWCTEAHGDYELAWATNSHPDPDE